MQVSFEPGSGWSATPDIPYRGSRNYLHGTDLYAASSAIVAAAVPVHEVAILDVRYPRFTRHVGTFRLLEGATDRARVIGSSVRIQVATSDGRQLTGWYEEADRQAAKRAGNHEESIVAATRIEGQAAKYIGDVGPPTIEIIVFMTKTLVQNLQSTGGGKWVFTALRSEGLLRDKLHDDVEIALEHSIGSRAVSCAVFIEKRRFGSIYFGRSDE